MPQKSFMPDETTVTRSKRDKKHRKKKPYEVWHRVLGSKWPWHRQWSRIGRYETREIAQKVVDDAKRKYDRIYLRKGKRVGLKDEYKILINTGKVKKDG